MSPSGNPSVTQVLRQHASASGISQLGIAPAVTPAGFHRLLSWIAAGYFADMSWIPRRRDAYRHPDGVMPGTRSVIIAAVNYCDGTQPEDGPRVARYALGSHDYHDVLKHRLGELVAILKERVPSARTRIVVDTAPLLERDFGQLAGLGWIGKNTMLISRSIGSWFVLGAILTDVVLDYDSPEEHDHCGTCSACLEACPTDAFPEPRVLDASRCISYLTIELRNERIPESLRSGMGPWLFGCDICQDVCPWNRFAPDRTLPEFRARPQLTEVDLGVILRLSEAGFQQEFRESPLSRSGRSGLLRNACIVAANLKRSDLLPELRQLEQDPDPVLRETADWAIRQLAAEQDF